MLKSRLFKLALLLLVTGLCFAIDAGLGLTGSAMLLGFLGVAGELTEEQKAQKADFMKTLGDGIKEGLAPMLEDLKAIVGKVKAEPVGVDLKKELRLKDANYRMSCYVNAIKRKDIATLKEMQDEEKAITSANNETTDGDGGYLVPTTTEARIRELIPTYSQALKLCEVMPMVKGNKINIPKLSTGVSGNWVNEQSGGTPEKVALGIDTLDPEKWLAIVPLSNELFEDANPAIGAFIIKHLSIGSGVALDTKVFQNGNSVLTGLFYSGNTFGSTILTSTTNPNSLTHKNLVDATLAVDFNYNVNPAWNMSPSMLGVVLTLTDLNGKPLFDYNTRTLLGYPVNIIMKAPTSADAAAKPIIIFGDLNNSTVGDVSNMKISIATEGSLTINGAYLSLLENDLSAVRGIKRYAFAPGLTGAYSIIKTALS